MLDFLMKSMGVDPQETLYVGDMTLDSETARNAGATLALIATGGHTKEELESVRPDYLFSSMNELVKEVIRD